MSADASHVVHLELHTANLARACAFHAALFGWEVERIESACGSYVGLGLGGPLQGGVVECASGRPLWLPYVEVADVSAAVARARALGAAVALEPREGPAGWRAVVSSPDAGEVALWQPKS
jgi:predicted enzyme related to lactoylglutathione lyase